MPMFSYKAVDQKGAHVQGTLVADNQQAAMGQLADKALFPIVVAEGSEAQSSFLGRQKTVRSRHLTVFYGQLADLLRAGVPVLRALDVLGKQTPNPTLSEIIREIREDVAGGMTLTDSMAKHPNAFNNLYLAMVRAGERGGFLEDVLARVAQFTERQDELKNKLIGSMVYPAILMFVGTTLITVLMTVVVPQLRDFLDQDKLNLLTKSVFGTCDILLNHGLFILLGLVLLVVGFMYYAKTPRGSYQVDVLALKMPVLGKTLIMIALCRFCRILGTMLSSGVPILQALKISRDSAGNEILAEEIDKAHDNVQRGGAMSEPLAQCSLLPMDVVDMIAVAEESNNLENVLVQIADSNEARTARMIDMGVRLIEPIMLVAMAGIIAIIAIALLVPILTMGSEI